MGVSGTQLQLLLYLFLWCNYCIYVCVKFVPYIYAACHYFVANCASCNLGITHVSGLCMCAHVPVFMQPRSCSIPALNILMSTSQDSHPVYSAHTHSTLLTRLSYVNGVSPIQHTRCKAFSVLFNS